jgi:hypothetical protein
VRYTWKSYSGWFIGFVGVLFGTQPTAVEDVADVVQSRDLLFCPRTRSLFQGLPRDSLSETNDVSQDEY